MNLRDWVAWDEFELVEPCYQTVLFGSSGSADRLTLSDFRNQRMVLLPSCFQQTIIVWN